MKQHRALVGFWNNLWRVAVGSGMNTDPHQAQLNTNIWALTLEVTDSCWPGTLVQVLQKTSKTNPHLWQSLFLANAAKPSKYTVQETMKPARIKLLERISPTFGCCSQLKWSPVGMMTQHLFIRNWEFFFSNLKISSNSFFYSPGFFTFSTRQGMIHPLVARSWLSLWIT